MPSATSAAWRPDGGRGSGQHDEGIRAHVRLRLGVSSYAIKQALTNQQDSIGEERLSKGNKSKKRRKMLRGAARAPAWLRDCAASKWGIEHQRRHRSRQLGTFGAASPVRRIDPSEY